MTGVVVYAAHWLATSGRQAAAAVVAFAAAFGLKVWLSCWSRPRCRHLRATRRNGSMLARPRVGGGYSRRW